MFCPDGVVDIPEACGAFNPGSNPGRDAINTENWTRKQLWMANSYCRVLKLFRARPNLICFNLFIYSSQPEQSMADGKIGFKGHFSPKSHLWSLQALEIQASMRSIVIPVDKLLE